MGLSLKQYVAGTVGLSVAYGLCLLYSGLVALHLLYQYATKRQTRFWVPKAHAKPAALSDPRYGEHKFIAVNVSIGLSSAAGACACVREILSLPNRPESSVREFVRLQLTQRITMTPHPTPNPREREISPEPA